MSETTTDEQEPVFNRFPNDIRPLLNDAFDEVDIARQEYVPYTGHRNLDRMVGRFREGELTVIVGQVESMKSAFCCALVQGLAKYGMNVGFVTPGMVAKYTCLQLICATAGVPLGPMFRSWDIVDDDWDRLAGGIQSTWERPIRISQKNMFSLKEIGGFLEESGQLDILVIDDTHLIQQADAVPLMIALKRFAIENAIPVVATVTVDIPPVDARDRRPSLRSLQTHEALITAADNVIGLFCPYRNGESAEHGLEVIFLKQRLGGVGTVLFAIDEDSGYIREYPFDTEDTKPDPGNVSESSNEYRDFHQLIRRNS